MTTVKMDFVSLVPPVLEIADDELQFLDFEEEPEFFLTPLNQ
jgi:hypothetical protein